MGVIIKGLPVKGDLGTAIARACFDSGSAISLMRRDVAERVASRMHMPNSRAFLLADGRPALEVRDVVYVDLTT